MEAIDHAAAIAELEAVLAGEQDVLNELYQWASTIPTDTVMYVDVTGQFIPEAIGHVNDTKLAIYRHKEALKGAQR